MKKQVGDTHILFIADESGSMQQNQKAVIDGFNEFRQSQINQSRRGKLKMPRMTLVKFNDNFNIGIVFSDKMLSITPELSYHTYRPTSSTALYDAIGQSVRGLEDRVLPGDRALVAIFTDGEENASREWKHGQVQELIRRKQEEGNWTFLFLGAGIDAEKIGATMSIPRGNTISYANTPVGHTSTYHSMNASTTAYRVSSAKSTKSFFETDLSGTGTALVKRKLTDIRAQVKVWTVDKETDIQTFCEFKSGNAYVPGVAFYQLTKPEIVQAYKDVMIMEKGKKAVYAGSEARGILGLPSTNTKVSPGNHSVYDVFVQSHSTNRKLVRGTKLVYKK